MEDLDVCWASSRYQALVCSRYKPHRDRGQMIVISKSQYLEHVDTLNKFSHTNGAGPRTYVITLKNPERIIHILRESRAFESLLKARD